MKRWYVVQVYTGYEDVVRTDLAKRVAEEGVQEFFGDVLVPKGEVVQFLSPDDPVTEKIFPGYLLVQMEMTGATHRLVNTTSRVMRFLGGASPMALTDREVSRIFSQIEGGVPVVGDRMVFALGSEVTIADGPFTGFSGIVSDIDEEHERLTVGVSIFGRLTPVELSYKQVKK